MNRNQIKNSALLMLEHQSFSTVINWVINECNIDDLTKKLKKKEKVNKVICKNCGNEMKVFKIAYECRCGMTSYQKPS